MKLQRLVEMIREDCVGVDDWPVVFASYRQAPAGEWQEIDTREPITNVQVETKSEEVLLIRDPTRPPLTVSNLERKLFELMACHSEFTVDSCAPPFVVDGMSMHLDLPVMGTGRDDEQRCYLLVFASSMK